MREIPPERIRGVSLTMLAGFLGAGKTTVLNHLIRANPGERIGVLVNDFGEIDIDADLVANADGETITLANGCICCTIKDDLVLTMFRLLHRDDPPRRILIECSGVSDPAEVVRAFADAQMHDIVRIESIVAVVDAESFADVAFREHPMALHQVVSADLVVLNKIDLVPEDARDAVETKLGTTVPEARILRAERGVVPFDVVLGTGRFDAARIDDEHDHADHADHGRTFASLGFEAIRPLDLARLRDALDALPVGVYRAKGIVHVDGIDDRQVIVHVVGKRIELEHGEPWPDGPRRTRLVAIGAAGSFDPDAVRSSLRACEVDPGQGAGGRLVGQTLAWIRKLTRSRSHGR